MHTGYERSLPELPDTYTAIKILHEEPKSSEKTTLGYSCIVRCTRVNIPLYAVLLKEVAVMAAVLAVHASGNVVAPYERILSVLQTYHFPD
ncbi:hypothetical protein TNCV_3212501 [Trichonephila clavipes]|nr:hypothetical protein TNCV_3212501 [Trichonephila clavipes]